MDDLDDLFKRQSEWQKSRASLSWSEKLEMAAVLRDAALVLRSPGTADRGWTRAELYDRGRANEPER